MEREMCQYLEWEFNMDPATLKEFEEMVHKDFTGIGSYLTYILPSMKKSTPPPSGIPFPPICVELETWVNSAGSSFSSDASGHTVPASVPVWIMYICYAHQAHDLKTFRAVFARAHKDRWTPWEVYKAAGV